MVARFIASRSMFYGLICEEVDCMRWAWQDMLVPIGLQCAIFIPAPNMTLEMPLHIRLDPSTLLIFRKAFVRPVYKPPSAGLRTCNRV